MVRRLPHARLLVRCAAWSCGVGMAVGAAAVGEAPPERVEAPRVAENAAPGTVVDEVSRACWYVFQAKNGDFWFGSDGEGVYRYDGKVLVNYTREDGLGGNRVRGLQEDKAGNIYITTLDGGISKFDGRVFTTLEVAETPEDGAGGGWRLNPDDLWFQWFGGMPGAAGTEGPYRYDGTKLYHLKLPKSEHAAAVRAQAPNATYSPYDVYSIYRDARGHMWFGTGGCGACRYDGKGFGWLYERDLTTAPNGGSFGIRSIIEDRDGAFWICNTRQRFLVDAESAEGKVAYTKEDGVDEKLTRGPLYFQGAVRDVNGDLWLAPYGGGIWRYDGKSMKNYPVKDEGMDTQVVSISKDNNGVVWLGTPSAGPYRFTGEAFEKFRPGR